LSLNLLSHTCDYHKKHNNYFLQNNVFEFDLSDIDVTANLIILKK